MTKKLSDSFKAAWRGLKDTLVEERSFKIMLIVTVLVIGAMFYFPTSRIEKVALLIMIFSVMILELINSVIERLLDFLHPLPNGQIKTIKDLMAAIVLVVSIGAVVIGMIIFLPYL
ncbi:MAG: diacylglycerol kinase family protein [Candidatus Paceibacterota bacterium]